MAGLIAVLETIEEGSGFLSLSGWAARDDRAAISEPAWIGLGDQILGSISSFDFRDDLKSAGIADGYGWYSCVIPFSGSSLESVSRLTILLKDGSSANLSPGDGCITKFKPRGAIDIVGAEGVVGWIFDPTLKFQQTHASLVLNGRHKINVQITHERSDIHFWDIDASKIFGFIVPLNIIISAMGSASPDNATVGELEFSLQSSGEVVATRREVWPKLAKLTQNPGAKRGLLRVAALRSPQDKVRDGPHLIPRPKDPSSQHSTHASQVMVGQGRDKDGKASPVEGEDGIAAREPSLLTQLHSNTEAQPAAARIASRHECGRCRVLVIAWDMGHNPAGRAFLLADLASRSFDVALLGPIFSQYGDSLWPPLRNQASIPITTFEGADFRKFFESALGHIEAHQPDIVYVSKARMPSLLVGMLFRLVKNSALVVDVDDHELSFFKERTPLLLDDALKLASLDPGSSAMPFSEVWTRLGESLVPYADAVTVSNVALQKRFGGVIVRHARDEDRFDISPPERRRVRDEFGLGLRDVAIVFIGTPRPHKGIFRIADALERIGDDRLVFVVIGSFTDARTRDGFKKYKRARLKFFDNQPWERLPELVRMADVIAILQDPASPIAEYQIPAKLTDALAVGVPVLATPVPPLADLISQGAIITIENDEQLDQALRATKPFEQLDPVEVARRRQIFLSELSYSVNQSRIQLAARQALAATKRPPSDAMAEAVYRIAEHLSVKSPLIERCRPRAAPAIQRRDRPFDVVFFWKQNDSDLYGRRSDMMVKYLLKSGRVRRIVHFDRRLTLSELERNLDHGAHARLHQGNHVYLNTVRRILKMADTPTLLRRTFLCRDGSAPQTFMGKALPRKDEYIAFVRQSLAEAGFDRSAVAWVCPVVFEFPEIHRELGFGAVIADIIDDQRKWQAKPDYMARVAQNYVDVLGVADLAVANCEPVREGFRDVRTDILVVPNGAEVFEPDRTWPLPEDIAGLPRPIIGYVGNLRDRIDLPLIEKVALAHPDWSIVLIGSAHDAIDVIALAERTANIHLLGVRPYEQALAYIRHFDVAMMPHLNNELSQNMNPLKLYVYHALGVPIVTTEVANIGDIGPVAAIATTHDQFLEGLRRFVSGAAGAPVATPANTCSREITWPARAEAILKHFSG